MPRLNIQLRRMRDRGTGGPSRRTLVINLDIKYLRWVLLALYVTLVLGLLWLGFRGDRVGVAVVLAVTLASQALFVFGAGTKHLCRPLRKRRLLLPVAMAACLLTLLVVAGIAAFTEMSRDEFWGEVLGSGPEGSSRNLWIFAGLNWVVWGLVFYAYTRGRDRFTVARRLVTTILSGSLLELLVSVPAHVVVSRRPGCFVGITTGLGVEAGLCVMLWAFGPGIALLFLRERRQQELRREEAERGKKNQLL